MNLSSAHKKPTDKGENDGKEICEKLEMRNVDEDCHAKQKEDHPSNEFLKLTLVECESMIYVIEVDDPVEIQRLSSQQAVAPENYLSIENDIRSPNTSSQVEPKDHIGRCRFNL
ncbi:unnamed protein product [Brachionus calyciflorus]|uniref:Uncharacterized protein n=1 Tax=Brachionus calyciflorus TaxID=104777 RepID=A0A813T5J9_9BILA|nr:unnamed protein product [Brachionus calyciflorus]